MKRSTRSRCLLLLGVAALVVLALWQWRSDVRHAPGTLLTLDPTVITDVTLQIGNTPATHYVKRADHWWHVDDTSQRADDRYLDTLTAAASAPVLQWRQASDFNATKIGLEPPHAVLTLDGQRLVFGAMSATGPQCYVQAGARVALISLRFMPQTPQSTHVELH